MATYIKTLKEDNGDITYPVTKAGAVLLNSGSDLETELSQYVTAEEIGSTAGVTPTITTAMVADDAITDDKIDWTSFGSSEWPIINANTSNNNVNTNQFYTQYEYTVPVNGVYMVMFSQRLTNGANNYDFTIRITYDNVQVQAVAAGGSTWVNWIPGTVFAFIEAKAGKIIRCQSTGGGTGSYTPQNGRVSIMRVR
jgi:hypothetical protein